MKEFETSESETVEEEDVKERECPCSNGCMDCLDMSWKDFI
jgi:hypothetical protein